MQPIDKWGNDGADELAVAGAQTHAPPCDVVKQCERRVRAAHATQSMMLRILKARARMEQAIKGSNEEILGDDMGDDPWNMDMPMYVAHPRSGEG